MWEASTPDGKIHWDSEPPVGLWGTSKIMLAVYEIADTAPPATEFFPPAEPGAVY
jgi:hypothetical protein